MCDYKVRIGIKRIAFVRCFRSKVLDTEYLEDTLEITHGEASRIYSKMMQSTSDNLTVIRILTEAQLGRYTADRQIKDLVGYWTFPVLLQYDKGGK